MKSAVFPSINRLAPNAIILAYRENTDILEKALRDEGFVVTTQRMNYSPDASTHSQTIRCLYNHRTAWQWASGQTTCTLIVESDFVPCTNFGTKPAPFDPTLHGSLAWAFLYAGGPRIMWAHGDGSLEGHAACPVAIVVSPRSAAILTRFAAHELDGSDPFSYSLWDTRMQWWAMGRKARCFLPWRHYGEHGGVSNPEHSKARIGWASRIPFMRNSDLFSNHRAECLVGPLKFLPPYAKGSRTRLFLQRLIARAIGWGRLMTGRATTPAPDLSPRERAHVHIAALRRLL